MQTILRQWKKYRRYLLVGFAICVCLTIASDSVYFEPVEVRDPITAVEVANTCSPSKIIKLDDVNISLGGSWTLGHSYHCLGHPHVVTTLNRVGVLAVDKLVSHAIVLNYVWLLNQTGELSCQEEVIKVNPYTVDAEGNVLFAAYILTCNEI